MCIAIFKSWLVHRRISKIKLSLGSIGRWTFKRQFKDNSIITTEVVCTFAEVLNTFAMMHVANSCLVRFFCLKWVSFMEVPTIYFYSLPV